jgi:hypothetical protein
MSGPAGVLVALEGRARAAAVIAAGAELARLLGLPLRGLVLQDAALADLGLSSVAHGQAPGRDPRALMAAAMAREARLLAAEFEAIARTAGLAVSIEARSGHPGTDLLAAAGAAEAVVMRIDPADRGAERQIAAAAALAARCAAVLLAPGRPRPGPGAVLALDGGGAVPDLAARLAEALGAPLVFSADEAEPALPWAPGGARPPRLIVAQAGLAPERLAHVMRRWRAPLLVLPARRPGDG